MVSWFPFNPQYTGFISTKIITYSSITQTLHIISISSNKNQNVLTCYFLTSLLETC